MYAYRPFVFCDMVVSKQDVATIEGMLGTATMPDETTWFWNLRDEHSGRVLALTISNTTLDVDAPDGQGAMACVVSVQTHQGYLELHDVTGYLCIEPDEVMFIAKHNDRFDSLVVGKTCTCSQFGNIRASLIRADLTNLNPSLLLAAMQLSLAESLLESLP